MIELQLGSFTTDRAQQILYIVLCVRDADFLSVCVLFRIYLDHYDKLFQ